MNTHRRVGAWLVVATVSLLWAAVGNAWNSIGPYTHGKIADDAINAISEEDYPDIHKFAEQLRDGSETGGIQGT